MILSRSSCPDRRDAVPLGAWAPGNATLENATPAKTAGLSPAAAPRLRGVPHDRDPVAHAGWGLGLVVRMGLSIASPSSRATSSGGVFLIGSAYGTDVRCRWAACFAFRQRERCASMQRSAVAKDGTCRAGLEPSRGSPTGPLGHPMPPRKPGSRIPASLCSALRLPVIPAEVRARVRPAPASASRPARLACTACAAPACLRSAAHTARKLPRNNRR